MSPLRVEVTCKRCRGRFELQAKGWVGIIEQLRGMGTCPTGFHVTSPSMIWYLYEVKEVEG